MDLDLSEDRIRAIVAHFAHLRANYGEAFAAPDLVEPTGEYFPDEFALEPDSIEQLVHRMMDYVPLSSDLDVGVAFIQPDGEVSGGGCGSGACSTGGLKEIARGGAIETDDGYAVALHVQDVGDPTILTTAIARGLGRVVLFEADEDVDPRDEGALSELTAIAAGLGLILLNGSCVYKKGCGGMKRHQATFLSVEEVAMGLALFVRSNETKPSGVRRHLEVTQKEAFDAALAWVEGQPALVRALREHPETLEDGVFEVESKKGLLSRLFTRPSTDERPMQTKRRERTEEELRRLAEAKALVDDALSES